MSSVPPKSEALQALFWRSEVLRVVYWLRGEGYGDLVDAPTIERFLGVDAATGVQYLDQLVEEGLLVGVDDRYKLSELGSQEGGLEFATSFEDLTKSAHGECGPDCPTCFPPEGEETDCSEGCPAFQMANEVRR